MAPVAIKQALLARGWSVTRLARQISKSRVATSGAIHRPARFPTTRKKIEEALRGN